MQTVLITGGTGLVGKALSTHLAASGFKVIILSRKLPTNFNQQNNISFSQWDVDNKKINNTVIQQADYIIHLAGAPVMDKKWTPSYKKEIVNSRTKSSALLIETLQQVPNRVKAIISASAIGWYGLDVNDDSNNTGFVETDPAAQGFLGETSKLWEDSIEPANALGIRVVKYRMGIVLSNNGGALTEFKNPIRFGIAGILGSGKQIISWIHIEDLCRLFATALTNEQFNGAYNAVAPETISNKKLVLALANKIKGKFFIPLHVPAFLLKLILGQRSIEVLKSTTVSCQKVKQTGFTFLYPSIEAAFTQLFKK